MIQFKYCSAQLGYKAIGKVVICCRIQAWAVGGATASCAARIVPQILDDPTGILKHAPNARTRIAKLEEL